MANIGELIRKARERRGLSQAELARLIGISQPSIQNIENGRTKDPRKLTEIASALGIPIGELRPGASFVNHENVTHAELMTSGQYDFPVYFTTGGSSEGTWVMSAEPVEYVERPAVLAKVKDSYGVRVSGVSMEPAYEAGDVVFVHPYLPPIAGVDILLRGEVHGEHRSMIKRLVRETETDWHLRQHNPPREFVLSKEFWPRADRVVGKYNRR